MIFDSSVRVALLCVVASAAASVYAATLQWRNSAECRELQRQQGQAWQAEYSKQAQCWAKNKCLNPGADPRFKNWTAANERLRQQCDESARLEKAQVEQQARLADETRKRSDEARKQVEQQRAYQDKLNQQHAQQLETTRREIERRQPVIVATMAPPPPRTHVVEPYPGAYAEQARAQQLEADRLAERNRQTLLANSMQQLSNMAVGRAAALASREEGDAADKRSNQAIRDNDKLRREMLDTALNPAGDRTGAIDSNVDHAIKANEKVNDMRGISPAVTQIQNDSLSAIGSMQNRTMGEYDRAMKQLDSLDVPASAPAVRGETVSHMGALDPGAGMPAATSSPAAQAGPVAVSSLDDLERASPSKTCMAMAFGMRAECVARQCLVDKFRNHAECRKPAQ
jgi:hypothetical protein